MKRPAPLRREPGRWKIRPRKARGAPPKARPSAPHARALLSICQAFCGALLALALAACSGPLPQDPPPPPKALTIAERLPKREDLVCFPCHSQVKFEKGPRFPHKKAAHKQHCHVCHEGMGHDGKLIDYAPCQTCHEPDSDEIKPFLAEIKAFNEAQAQASASDAGTPTPPPSRSDTTSK